MQTAYGVLPGGYFPIAYNPKMGSKVKELDIMDNVNRLFGSSGPGAAMTKTGHNKERAKMGLGIPLLLDPKVAADHMFNVVHDITHRKAVMDAAKIIKHPKVKYAIESAYGTHIYKELMPWLRDVANEQQGNFDGFQKVCGFIRTNLSIAAMGLKAGTAIQQLSGFTKTITQLGYRQTLHGFKTVYSNPLQFKAMLDETFARSTFMATRMNNYNRDIRDATKVLDGNVGMRAWPSKIKKIAFTPMCIVQMSIDLPTWWGAFEKGLKTFKGNEIKAAEYADSAVRLTQGSGEAKDLARIQRGTNAHKLLTCFYSDFNLHYNLVAREISSLRQNLTPRTIFNTANTMLLLWVGEALLSELLSGRGPDDDENPAEWAADIIIRAPFQGVVGVRDVVNAVRSPFGYEITPAASVAASGVNWIYTLWKAIEEDEPEKLVKPTLKAIAYMGGLPLDGPFIPIENVYDYLAGNDPEFYFRDLLYRKPKSRR